MPDEHEENAQEIRDAAYFSLAEQIHRDYLEFIKAIIMPKLNSAHDIKLRETRILATIAGFDGPVSSSNVAEDMRIDPATIARALILLVGNNYVTTTANFQDGRSRLIQLTEAGQNVVDDYVNILADGINDARKYGGIIMNEEEEIQFLQYMMGVRNRASSIARVIKKLSRMTD